MLNSIDQFCADGNLSGVLQVEYAPINEIDRATHERIINAVNNWQYDILITNGWRTVGLFQDPRKKRWTETPRPTVHGPTYQQSITGITRKLKPEVTATFEQMANHRFIIRLTDLNGQKWIIGTIDQPFEFQARSTTGNNGSAAQYSITFQSTTSKRAHGFDPEF